MTEICYYYLENGYDFYFQKTISQKINNGGEIQMYLFDTYVQKLKYKALLEVARLAYAGELTPVNLMGVPEKIIPGPKASFRCCIYKERAIMGERVKLALGGKGAENPIINVIDIACDECPVDGIQVTQSCRGCIAHRCMNACPKDAITIVDHRATIDKKKCIECGRCMEACSYSAIVKHTRPCMRACKPGALTIDQETDKAVIDEEKCINCGACVYQCPFGAISDRSFITDAINMIRESENNTKFHVYAVVAPSIASQYPMKNVSTEQVVAGISALGFHSVIEAAWGADLVAQIEAEELLEKGFLTSSCCPAFVRYVQTQFPQVADKVSHTPSPMAKIAEVIKRNDPTSRVVFIGPCIAKKAEAQLPEVSPHVDCALTFEEMQAMFDARDIDLESLEGIELDNASYYGRVFARSGGLAVAVKQAIAERGVTEEEFKLNAISCNGIQECKVALLKASKGLLPENFIEGMACVNGCIGGPACLTHSSKDKAHVDEYGKLAMEKTIGDATKVLNLTGGKK